MPIVWFLSYLIPKKDGLYVFGSTRQTCYRGNPRYLFEEALTDESLESIFVTSDSKVYSDLKEKGFPVEINFLKKLWFLLRAEYCFVETTPADISPFYILLGRFNIINLWHGTPLKKIEKDSKKLSKLYSFVTGFNNKR